MLNNCPGRRPVVFPAVTLMAVARSEAGSASAIVATGAALAKPALTRLATAAHDGLARAIVPSHTPFDGDLVFALSTGSRAAAHQFGLGHAAACVLARAVARAVFAAAPAPGDRQPCWHERARA